jgi:hypothetical protein
MALPCRSRKRAKERARREEEARLKRQEAKQKEAAEVSEGMKTHMLVHVDLGSRGSD